MAAAGKSGASGLSFGILGPLRVLRFAEPINLGGARQRAVLARLLVDADRDMSVDALADALWADAVPPGYRATLQTYVFHLRTALEPGRPSGAPAQVLVTVAGGYRLVLGKAELDADRFEQLVEAAQSALAHRDGAAASAQLTAALALWRGPVLADLAGFGFVAPVAARLEGLRLDAVEARLDAELSLGRDVAVAAEATELVRQHPLRERLHGQRMMALYRCGRQSEAFEAYAELRRTLVEELGVEPSPPVQELHRRLLAQDPGLIATSAPAAASDGPAAPTTRLRRHPRPRLLVGAVAAALATAGATGAVLGMRGAGPAPKAAPPDSIAAVDAAGSVRGWVVLAQSPDAVTSRGKTLWVADTVRSTVTRIDAETSAVARPVGLAPGGIGPVALTLLGPHLWVANTNSDNVSEISTATGAVVATVPVGHNPSAIAAGYGAVWVTNQADGTVSEIDPALRHPPRRLDVGDGPDGIAVGDGGIWVANGEDGTVSRIEPQSGQVSSPIRVGAGPAGIVAGPAAVWVANSLDGTVSRIAAETEQVTAVRVGDTPTALARFADAVWVGNTGSATLTRIDEATGQPTRTIPLDAPPRGLAASASGLWITTGPIASSAYRGGTLTIAVTSDRLGDIDPVLDYGDAQFFALYHGLVGVHRADGAQAYDLVPDLALSLPIPTDGGTAYSFSLRAGLRYSDGRPVRAADFRSGLERAVRLAAEFGLPEYYQGILGAPACASRPDQTCDLRRGIVTDDRARTVVIRLSRPDPDFLAKLAAWTFAIPVPAGTPQSDVGATPVPSTGPYRIGEFQKGRLLTVVRNPFFRVWSTAAQPEAYPDVIRWVGTNSYEDALRVVEDGRADLAYVSPKDSEALRRRYPTRLWQPPTVGTHYLALNAHLPPFDNAGARRAVAYALTRNQDIAAQKDGQPSCTIVPPGWPGQTLGCPYPTDLLRARELVRSSGTYGRRVHVYFNPGEPDLIRVAEVTTAVLDRIGYRADLTLTTKYDPEGDPSTYEAGGRPINAGGFQWWPDFPAVSQYYEPVLSCDQGILRRLVSCNSALDAAAAAALRTQFSDPGAAQRQWQAVYRDAEADARLVPNSTASGESVLVSARVGNVHFSPFFGPLLDQLQIRPLRR